MAIKNGYLGKWKFMLMVIETYHCFLTSRSRLLFGFNVSTDKFSINVINRLFLER